MDEMKRTDAETTDDFTDLPPELCVYRDEGCELAPSCLNCPFPHCLEEDERGRGRLLRTLRARAMADLRSRKKKSLDYLARRFGVSKRTVQRALSSLCRRKRNGRRSPSRGK